MPICKYCNQEIKWIKRGNFNVPVFPDGSEHRGTDGKCIKNQQQLLPQLPTTSTQNLNLSTIEQKLNKIIEELEKMNIWLTNFSPLLKGQEEMNNTLASINTVLVESKFFDVMDNINGLAQLELDEKIKNRQNFEKASNLPKKSVKEVTN